MLILKYVIVSYEDVYSAMCLHKSLVSVSL